MKKTKTRRMYEKAIEKGQTLVTKRDYKRALKALEVMPLWWQREPEIEKYEDFHEGVLQGYAAALARMRMESR